MRSYKDEAGIWQHSFRQSWLGEAARCAESARRTHLGLGAERETDAACIGTAAHTVYETCIGMAQHGDPLDADGCAELWHREFDGQIALDGFVWAKYTETAARKFGEQCVRDWHSQVLPTLDVHGAVLEHTFHVQIHQDDQRVIELSGTIDYVDQIARDWKHPSRPYEPWEKKRWDVQSTAYTFALKELCWRDVDPYKFEFIAMCPPGKLAPQGVQRLTVDRDERHWSWLRAQCVRWAKLIEAELDEWPAQDQNALCSPLWCEHWSQCKGASLGENPFDQKLAVAA